MLKQHAVQWPDLSRASGALQQGEKEHRKKVLTVFVSHVCYLSLFHCIVSALRRATPYKDLP